MTPQPIADWLAEHDLGALAPVFEAHQLDLDMLRDLDEDDFAELGITLIGQRKRLARAIAELRQGRRPIAWPEGLGGEAMPSYLATPLAALLAEPHPRLRLHWLVDCAEIALRWSVALALAETIHAGGGTLPEALLKRLRDQIERPTLGQWLNMLAALSEAAPTAVLVPGVFSLYRDHFDPLMRIEPRGGSMETSLLVLRNHLYHGGGLSTDAARPLLAAHEAPLFDLLRAVTAVTSDTILVGLEDGRARRLLGTEPRAVIDPAELPAPLQALLRGESDEAATAPSGPWLANTETAMPLWPLADFGPVLRIDANGELRAQTGGAAAQIYLRTNARGPDAALTYTPLGRDEPISQRLDLDAFRALFRLADPLAHARAAGDPLHWCAFLDEAAIEAEALIGRAAEVQQVKDWLKGRNTRIPVSGAPAASIGWLSGRPGIGKSLLMAKVAADFSDADPAHQAVYFHQFRGGDARNSPRAFALGLLAALDAWPLLPQPPADAEAGDPAAQPDDRLFETLRKRLEPIAALTAPNPRSAPPRLLVLLDGLDEVARLAPWLPARLRQLALPGTVWLLAGRPEPALQQAFSGPGCEALFPDGLPSLPAADVRAILLDGLAQSRHRLVARDQDQPDGVSNPFIDRVVAAANGLPIYVRCVVHDLLDDVYTVHDEKRLAPDWVAYLDDLIQREGVSDVVKDRTDTVALLARAEEPLEADGLALLLGALPEHASRYNDRVARVVRTSATLLRGASTPEGTPGLALYHQSLRDRVGGQPALSGQSAIPPAPYLAGSVTDAECKLCDRAAAWQRLPPGNLRNHLFRWGVRYALRWQGAKGLESALARLTDFAFLQALTAELPAGDLGGLVADYGLVLDRLPHGSERDDFRLWEAFFREREHILRRGNERWPANKILLQLAVEHGDDSPLTRVAEQWLRDGHCDWVWWRNPRRPRRAVPDPCLGVLAGHKSPISGVLALDKDRILSWSQDNTWRAWHWRTRENVVTAANHEGPITGLTALSERRILTWTELRSGSLSSVEKTALRIWDAQSGHSLVRMDHPGCAEHVVPLYDGNILSVSRSAPIPCVRVWDGRSGHPIRNHTFESSRFTHSIALADGRVVLAEESGAVRCWDATTGTETGMFKVDGGRLRSLVLLNPEQLLTQSEEQLCIWDLTTCLLTADLGQHPARLENAMMLHDGRVLGWDKAIAVWKPGISQPMLRLPSADEQIDHVIELRNDRIAVATAGGDIFVWSLRGGSLEQVLPGHEDKLRGLTELPDGRLLSWSDDASLRTWDLTSGIADNVLQGHSGPVWDVLVVDDGPDPRILSYARNDPGLRLWDVNSGANPLPPPRHRGPVRGVRNLEDNRLLTWSTDATLRLWDTHAGSEIAVLQGHASRQKGGTPAIQGADLLSWGRIVSWASDDPKLRTWDPASGKELAEIDWNAKEVTGIWDLIEGMRLTPEDRAVVWAWDDALYVVDLRPEKLRQQEERKAAKREGRRASREPQPRARCLANPSGRIRGVWNLRNEQVVTVSDNRKLGIWNLRCGTQLATLEGHAKGEVRIERLADDRFLSWTNAEANLQLWQPPTDRPLASLCGHTGPVLGVQLLSEHQILTWSADGTLRIWDAQSGAPGPVFAGHSEPVLGAQAIADDQILSWAKDNTLRVWEMASGQCRALLIGHESAVEGARQLADGSLVSWDKGHQLYRWNQHTGQSIGGPFPLAEAPWQQPEALLAIQQSNEPESVQGSTVAWSDGNQMGISALTGGDQPACWHAAAELQLWRLDLAGIAIVTQNNGTVACLQLLRGDRRIDTKDFETAGLSPAEWNLAESERAIAGHLAEDQSKPDVVDKLIALRLARADCLADLARHEDAHEEFTLALELLDRSQWTPRFKDKKRAGVLRNRALASSHLGRRAEAFTDLSTALDLLAKVDQQDAEIATLQGKALEVLAWTYTLEDRLPDAISPYKQAIAALRTSGSKDPEHLSRLAQCHRSLGVALSAAQRHAEAAREYSKAIALFRELAKSDKSLRSAILAAREGLGPSLLAQRRYFRLWLNGYMLLVGFADIWLSKYLRNTQGATGDEIRRKTDELPGMSKKLARSALSEQTRLGLGSFAETQGLLEQALQCYESGIAQGSRKAVKQRNQLCAMPWYLWAREGHRAAPFRFLGELPSEPAKDWSPSAHEDKPWVAVTGESARPHLDGLASLLELTGNTELLRALQTHLLGMRAYSLSVLPGWTVCEVLIRWRGQRTVLAFLSGKDGALLRSRRLYPLQRIWFHTFSSFDRWLLILGHYFEWWPNHRGYICSRRRRASTKWELVSTSLQAKGSKRTPGWVWSASGHSAPPRRYPGAMPTDASVTWGPPPIVGGCWRGRTGEEARPLLDALWSTISEFGFRGLQRKLRSQVRSLRVRSLACYRGWYICEARISIEQGSGALPFLAAEGGAVLFSLYSWNLGSPRLGWLNTLLDVRLRSPEEYLDYFTVVAAVTRNPGGAVENGSRLVDSIASLPWRSDLKPEKRAAWSAKVTPPYWISFSEEGARLGYWVAYQGSLFRAKVSVSPFGNMQMDLSGATGEKGLLDDFNEQFIDGVRVISSR
jgi:WD40 repeat protein